MGMTRFSRPFKTVVFLLLTVVCVTSGYFITQIIRFPDHIQMMEGGSNELAYNLPASATIEAENCAALFVNDKPVGDNITINLQDKNKIEPQGAGKAKMTLTAFGFPMKKVTLDIFPDTQLVPCGMTVGVKINTTGVMVLGTGDVSGQDGKHYSPSKGILESGDLIIEANSCQVATKEQLGEIIKESCEAINLKVIRENEVIDAQVDPVTGKDANVNQIGVWVRDGTKGIGTVTYYNPSTNRFAALGHGILDLDTKQIMSIENGEIKQTSISSVNKGRKGAPGELIGDINSGALLGRVEHNSPYGIFGTIDPKARNKMPREKMRVAMRGDVHEGPATIRCNVNGGSVSDYDIYVESVNNTSPDDTRGMVIRITDPDLLRETGGIVQGMSGSPIMQDGALIGAVTHVFVQDPAKGYGILSLIHI